ncbi:MAG: fumarylacetoacetase, partial [Zoogloea sp.]|nr:fumarylacetoacetase [Zoogloea sp.]
MNPTLDETHDPTLVCWVESANDPATDFPLQNLPLGRFRRAGEADWRIGAAIGDQVVDLLRANLVATGDMNTFLAAGREARRALRLALSRGLRHGSTQKEALTRALLPLSEVEMGLPCRIGDYTDFYTGIHHARTVGGLFRPDNPLLPNYKWVPIGYHGRASSIVASGQAFRRPRGQTSPPDGQMPGFGPTRRLDYELELGVFVAVPSALGVPVSMEDAEAHLCGLTLLNDWS